MLYDGISDGGAQIDEAVAKLPVEAQESIARLVGRFLAAVGEERAAVEALTGNREIQAGLVAMMMPLMLRARGGDDDSSLVGTVLEAMPYVCTLITSKVPEVAALVGG